MQQDREPGEQGFSQQRVIAALMRLSALALETSMLRFSAPDVADRLATVFLDQLVTICEAQQGAFFLLHPFPESSDQETVLLPPSPSLLASARMSAEEAQIALTNAVPVPAEASGNLPQTLCWTRSLEVGFLPQEYTNKAAFPATPQLSAVLLFIWSEQSTRQEAQRQIIQLLPLLADLVDTILSHLFIAQQERQQLREVFPTELLATVGHEFRGPLTTIQGYATTLLRYDQHLVSEERRDFLHAINEASTRLSTLVGRFLELAQLESRSNTFISAPVNMLALVQESITAVQQSRSHHLLLVPSLVQREEALERDQNREAFGDELMLAGDRRLLRTMLDMLLENAVAYSAPESLVEVAVEPMTVAAALAARQTPSRSGTHLAMILPARFEEQEPLIAIRVRDHGIGIEPAHLALIFRRFYRVDTRLTREVNGLGLGLALCRAIVSLHRGMLWVESAVGEGSTFSLVLPRGMAKGMGESVEIE